jgi:hypothetical protein
MTFGQILDRTYRLMRAHLKLFTSIGLVPSIALIAVAAAVVGCMLIMVGPQLAGKTHAPPALPGLWMLALVSLIYLILPLVYALYMPAASYAATQADLGVAVSFRESYAVAWRRFGRYVWLIVLTALYVVLPFGVIAALGGFGAFMLGRASGTSAGPATAFFLVPLLLLLYLGLMVYSILIMLRFALAFPASMAEGLTAWASLQRSALLTRGAKGRIFLVLLIVYAASYLVNLVCMVVFLFVAAIVAVIAMMAHVAQGSVAFFVLIGLGGLGYGLTIVAGALVVYAAYTTALAVIYHDQRLRKDGPLPAAPASVELA